MRLQHKISLVISSTGQIEDNIMKLLLRLNFRCHQIQAPTINIARYINKANGWEKDCEEVASALHKYGLLYAEDSRVNAAQNDRFLDLMEQYFAKRSRQFDQGLKDIDVVESVMPIGLKHCYHQKFTSYQEDKDILRPPHLSQTPSEAVPDPTWRFHWVINSPYNIKPADFPQFESIINSWGSNLKNCGLVIAEMAAIGLGLDKHTLSDKIVNGGFYMSPTGIDLSKSSPGKLLTSFHRDFDLLTIHGRSRYAGLYAWLNTGEKFLVRVPTGQLLVQGGKQLEWMTGGYIKAGFHEVIHNELVEEAKVKTVREGKQPWRVASTLFCQVEGSQSIKPLSKFQSEEINKKYPDITADQYVLLELQGLYSAQD